MHSSHPLRPLKDAWISSKIEGRKGWGTQMGFQGNNTVSAGGQGPLLIASAQVIILLDQYAVLCCSGAAGYIQAASAMLGDDFINAIPNRIERPFLIALVGQAVVLLKV